MSSLYEWAKEAHSGLTGTSPRLAVMYERPSLPGRPKRRHPAERARRIAAVSSVAAFTVLAGSMELARALAPTTAVAPATTTVEPSDDAPVVGTLPPIVEDDSGWSATPAPTTAAPATAAPTTAAQAQQSTRSHSSSHGS